MMATVSKPDLGEISRGDVEALTRGLQHGFNMATESKPYKGDFSRGDVDALTRGLQHGFNMASTWPLNPRLILGNSVVGMLKP